MWPSSRLWPSGAEWQVIVLTLRVALMATGCGLPLALICARALAWRFPGRSLLNAAVHLPLAVPPVVTGWFLLVLCGVEGPVGAFLWRRFQLRLAFTTQGAALACLVMTFPIMVRAIRQAIEAVDGNLLQAARTLGAGGLDRFWSITLPLAVPGVMLAAVLGFTASLGEFGAVITFAANIPGETQTLPLAIYQALQVPGGEAVAARLSLYSVALAVTGLLISEAAARRVRR